MKEIFKKIVVEGREMEVSNLGTIRYQYTRNGSKLKNWERKSGEFKRHEGGYQIINIGKKKVLVHHIVATAFIPKPDEVNKYVLWFIDRNKENIAADNMIWISLEEMHQRMALEFAGKKLAKSGAPVLEAAQVRNIRMEQKKGVPIEHLARKYGVSHAQIRRIVRRENFAYID
jgi:hypothetical protein